MIYLFIKMEKKKFVSEGNEVSRVVEVIENKSQGLPKSTDIDENIRKYVDSLNSSEKIAYEIAKTRLKSSFDIEKSIGYKLFISL
jgi:hypothetical protein